MKHIAIIIIAFMSILSCKAQQPIISLQNGDIAKLQALQTIKDDKDDTNGDGVDEYEKFSDDLKDTYMDNANGKNGSALEYQKTFLEFLNDKDLGVSLYKMEQTNNGSANVQENWIKLTLDAASPNGIKKTNCN